MSSSFTLNTETYFALFIFLYFGLYWKKYESLRVPSVHLYFVFLQIQEMLPLCKKFYHTLLCIYVLYAELRGIFTLQGIVILLSLAAASSCCYIYRFMARSVIQNYSTNTNTYLTGSDFESSI